MTEPPQEKAETLEQKLNRDTDKINWSALDNYQQQKAVVLVADTLDLISVAVEFVNDNRSQVEKWMTQSQISLVTDEQASDWKKNDKEFWAVVVAPWVLIQDQKPKKE